jgi:hypothetical protein
MPCPSCIHALEQGAHATYEVAAFAPELLPPLPERLTDWRELAALLVRLAGALRVAADSAPPTDLSRAPGDDQPGGEMSTAESTETTTETTTEATTKAPAALHSVVLTDTQRRLVFETQQRAAVAKAALKDAEREALQTLALVLDAHGLPLDTLIRSFDEGTGVMVLEG